MEEEPIHGPKRQNWYRIHQDFDKPYQAFHYPKQMDEVIIVFSTYIHASDVTKAELKI